MVFFPGEEGVLAVGLAQMGWSVAYVPDVVAHHDPAPGRYPALRRRLDERSLLIGLWLQRPVSMAARRTARTLSRTAWDPAARGAIAGVVRAVPRIARRRRPACPDLGAACASSLRLAAGGHKA